MSDIGFVCNMTDGSTYTILWDEYCKTLRFKDSGVGRGVVVFEPILTCPASTRSLQELVKVSEEGTEQ